MSDGKILDVIEVAFLTGDTRTAAAALCLLTAQSPRYTKAIVDVVAKLLAEDEARRR